ncbi:MAG TPA: hypothetical protein VFW68_13460 [Rhodocyclaceae bacterium]|nr:hypothetical protein [Rhodocyclaceae bacterium]
MNKKTEIQWLAEPEEHNYPAAKSYLSLLFDDATCDGLVAKLRAAPMASFKAKDIFRASELSLLGISNGHVERDRLKVTSGKQLSPLLLVRDAARGKTIVADGYHRLCAVYSFSEDELIPCKIV